MKRAELRVSNHMFQDYLPDGVRVIGARVDIWKDETIFLLESESFPEAQSPREARMTITRRSPFEVQLSVAELDDETA